MFGSQSFSEYSQTALPYLWCCWIGWKFPALKQFTVTFWGDRQHGVEQIDKENNDRAAWELRKKINEVVWKGGRGGVKETLPLRRTCDSLQALNVGREARVRRCGETEWEEQVQSSWDGKEPGMSASEGKRSVGWQGVTDRQGGGSKSRLALPRTKGSLLWRSGVQWEGAPKGPDEGAAMSRYLHQQDHSGYCVDSALCVSLCRARWAEAFPEAPAYSRGRHSFSKDGDMLVRAGDGLGPGPWGSCSLGSWEPNFPHPKGLWLSAPKPLGA